MSKLAFNRTSKTLLLGWRWLLAGAIVATLIAAAYVFTRPRTYEASVDVLPDRVRTDIRLSTTIQSVSPNAAQQPSGQNQAPSTVLNPITPERRQSLALLVRNADIEAAVREELKGKLPANLTAPGQLLKLVQGRLMSHTEVIRITVETADPALSEAVASSWARAYERQVNRLYTSPTSTLDVVDSEVQAAHQKYENAQRTLDNFTGSSHLEEHRRLIERRQQLLKDMIASRQVLVADLSKVSEQVALQLGQAQALQQHLAAATDNSAAATNSAALSLLKSEVFASSAALPSNLQVQLPANATSATLAQQRDDVAAMIVALRAWQDRLQLQIVSLSQEAMGSGQTEGAGSTDAALVAASRGIEAELRDLQGQASQEEAQQKDLTQNRDVTWQTYQELHSQSKVLGGIRKLERWIALSPIRFELRGEADRHLRGDQDQRPRLQEAAHAFQLRAKPRCVYLIRLVHRRVNAHEQHARLCQRAASVARKRQPARCQLLPDKLFEARLKDRRLPLGEALHPIGIGIDTTNTHPAGRKTSCYDDAEMPQPVNADLLTHEGSRYRQTAYAVPFLWARALFSDAREDSMGLAHGAPAGTSGAGDQETRTNKHGRWVQSHGCP